MEIDRMFDLTVLLDNVIYKSSIEDMRHHYFSQFFQQKSWLVFSDYYLEDKKVNNVISFTVMPHIDLMTVQNEIRRVAPKDIKHTQTINPEFIKLIDKLPAIHFTFAIEKKKYYLWETGKEVKEYMAEVVNVLNAYILYWKNNPYADLGRLDKLAKNIKCLGTLVQQEKKLRLIAAMFLISLLGGYVGSLICRESKAERMVWLSDRDSTNEICNNLVRDLFQMVMIDIIKYNIQFMFTTANSNSDEWYMDITRIPDYLTGTIASFDFAGNSEQDQKVSDVLKSHFNLNTTNTFIYKLDSNGDKIVLKRYIIVGG